MMNPNTISAEASAGQQTLTSTEKKGANHPQKGLFSRLLASLQGNTQNGTQKNHTVTAQQNKNASKTAFVHKQSLSQQNPTKDATGEKTKPNTALQSAEKKIALSQGAENKVVSNQATESELVESNLKLHHTTQKNIQQQLPSVDEEKVVAEVDTSAVIAVAQEPSLKLQPQHLPQAKDVIASNSKPMPNKDNKPSQPTTQQIVIPQLEETDTAITTNLNNPKIQNKAEQAVTTPLSTSTQPKAHGTSKVEEVVNPQRGKQHASSQKEREISALHTRINNKIDNTDPLETVRNPQATVLPLQQRSARQASGNNAILTPQNSSSIITRTFDQRDPSSQQDFTSNQHNSDQTLFDVSKTDHKNSKNLDFQAQLAYRSQRTFTPANTMLEIVRSAKDGQTSLELQLEPAHLGKVHINIQMDLAKQIQVSFTLDQATSRQALEQHMPQLRLALAQQGLDLGGFSMQMNQQGNQQGNAGSSDTAHSIADNLTTASAPPDDNSTRIGVNLASNGHLNIMA